MLPPHTFLGHLHFPSLNNNLKAKAKKEKWLFQIPRIQTCQKIKTNRAPQSCQDCTGYQLQGHELLFPLCYAHLVIDNETALQQVRYT